MKPNPYVSQKYPTPVVRIHKEYKFGWYQQRIAALEDEVIVLKTAAKLRGDLVKIVIQGTRAIGYFADGTHRMLPITPSGVWGSDYEIRFR